MEFHSDFGVESAGILCQNPHEFRVESASHYMGIHAIVYTVKIFPAQIYKSTAWKSDMSLIVMISMWIPHENYLGRLNAD